MKVVINRRFGGFSISREAAEFMAARGNKRAQLELDTSSDGWYGFGSVDEMDGYGYDRSDPDLIAAVKELGKRANGYLSELKIVEIPDGTEYKIDDYDGMESIHEIHQEWS